LLHGIEYLTFFEVHPFMQAQIGKPLFIQSVSVTNDTPSSAASSCLDKSFSESCGWLPLVLKCSCSSALTASRMHRLRALVLNISIAFDFGSKE